MQNVGLTKFLLLPVFFPWVSFGLNNMDSQPYALISVILLILMSKTKINISSVIIILILCSVLVGTQFFLPTELQFLARGMIGFVGFFIFFDFFRRRTDLISNSYNFLLFTNVIWILGGVIEIFFPELIAFFGAQRSTENRGVTSFSPEPSFFGFVLFNYFVIIALIKEYIPKRSFIIIQLLNVLATIFLAQSPVAIVYFTLLFGLIFYFSSLKFFLHKLKKKNLVLYPIYLFLIIFAVSIIIQYTPYFDGSRVVTLVSSLWQNFDILELIYLDASLNHRVEHIVLPWVGTFTLGGIPAGVGAFDYSREFALQYFNGFFWHGEEGKKVMSWIGDWVITFGLLGMLLLVYIFYVSYPSNKKHTPYFWAYLFLLFSAIPLANPLVPITLAVFCKVSSHGRSADIKNRVLDNFSPSMR